MHISKFTINEEGNYEGKIHALGLGSVNAYSKPAASKDNKVYHRLYSQDELGEEYEIGSMWPKVKDDLNYFSVSLDSPFLPEPISAVLFPDKQNQKVLNLVWQRHKPKTDPMPDQTLKTGTDVAKEEAEVASVSVSDDKAVTPAKSRRFLGVKATP